MVTAFVAEPPAKKYKEEKKMRMKKFLAGFLSAAMILAGMPSAAFASGTDIPETTSQTDEAVTETHEHDYSGEPVLSEDGTKLVYTCTVEGCEETYEEEYVPKEETHEHDYSGEPVLSEDGTKLIYTCTVEGCEETYEEEYAADTPTVVDEEDAAVTDGVAQIGDTQYKTLAEAIGNATSNNNTIVLIKDVTESITISTGQNIVLDLHGQTLTAAAGKDAVTVAGGTLTVQDTTAGNGPSVSADFENVTYTSGTITATYNAISVYNGGKLTVKSGTFKSTMDCSIYVGARKDDAVLSGTAVIEDGYIEAREFGIGVMGEGSSLSIKGGVIVAQDNAAVAGNGTLSPYMGGTTINITGGTMIGHIKSAGYIACGVYHPQAGTLNISGGTIYADGGVGILMRGGTLDLTGGEVIATGNASGKVGDSTMINGCYGVLLDGKADYYGIGKSRVSISGSASVSADEDVAAVMATDSSTGSVSGQIEITGGKFSSDVSDYLADGYTYDGTTGEVTSEKKNVVLLDNDGTEEANYETLQEAIDAATEGQTVKLLNNITESITVASDKNIALDLNGHTLTNEANKDTITILLSGKLTVDGSGKVDCVSGGYAAVYNNGEITLNGGTYTRTASSWYTVVNHGQMYINANAAVTVDASVDSTSSMIENGYYSYSSTNPNPRNNFVGGTNQARPTLTINGGTFTGGRHNVKNDDGGVLIINAGNFIHTNTAATTDSSIYNCGIATINGGTFTSKQYAIYNLDNSLTIDGATVSTSTTITNGFFTGKLYVGLSTTMAISGGTFTALVKESWCEESYVPVAETTEGNTYYNVVEGQDIVSVEYEGTTNKYTSLIKAVAAAKSGATITLLADVELSEYVKISDGKKLTLDLSGYSISRMTGVTGAYLIYITGDGTELTVVDSGDNATGIINAGDNPSAEAIYGGSKSKVFIKNGSIKGGKYGIYVYTNCTLEVNGGIVSGETSGIYICSKTANVSIDGGNVCGGDYGIHDLYGIVTIQGNASISGDQYGILTGYAPSSATSASFLSSVTVKGGNITGDSAGICVGKGKTTLEVTGGTISGKTYGIYDAATNVPTLTISDSEDGTTSPVIKATDSEGKALESSNCTGFVTGGYFSDIEDTYCAVGYASTMDTERNLYRVALKEGWYEINEYRSADNYTYPEKEGYVFAGWYISDEEFSLENALGVSETTGVAYAKFVDAKVLQAMWQMTAGTTAESETTNLRFITTVDSLNYQSVGFDITLNGKTISCTTNTVYEHISGNTEEGTQFYSPTVFSNTSKYFMTYALNNVPKTAFGTQFTVTPKWVTLDGTTVTGQALNFTINNKLSN